MDSAWRSPWPRTRRSAPGRSTRSAPTSRSASGCRGSARGEQLGAFGLTEPEAGSDAGNVRTARATLDDGDWVINGAKQFITNAGTDISGFVTITARTGDGRDLEHHRAERHARLRGRRAATARWAGTPPTRGRSPSTTAACPRRTCSARAGRASGSSCRRSTAGASASSAMGVGLAQGALDEALAYAKERRAFGKPISKFQAIQIKLADMSTEIEAARLLTYKAAHREGRRPATSRSPPRRPS